MKKLAVLALVAAIGGAAYASPMVGLGGLLAPVTQWEEYPAVTIIPRIVIGGSYGASLVLTDLWFRPVGEEGQWATGLVSDICLSYGFRLGGFAGLDIYAGPSVAGNFLADTSDEGEFSLGLVPYWGIKLIGMYDINMLKLGVTLDFASNKGIIPGFMFSVSLPQGDPF